MKRQDLSIIIPVYNGQDYIGRCLNSVLNQRNIDKYEIIVVNDGSYDETPHILDKFAQENANIRILTQENAGVSVARNNGIRAARGKYITFVDCDDMVGLNATNFEPYFANADSHYIGNMNISTVNAVPNALCPEHFDNRYFLNLMQAAYETDADVVMGGKITINRDEIYTRRHIYTADKIYDSKPNAKYIALKHANVRENANFALYRREMLTRRGLRFLPNMKLDEDILFCMLATLYASRVATVKDVTYFYHRHSDTLSNIRDVQQSTRKYQIANIQRFSVLMNELAGRPGYEKTFTYWMRDFARHGIKYTENLDDFPPTCCHLHCNEEKCVGCFIATTMQARAQANIKKYLGNGGK